MEQTKKIDIFKKFDKSNKNYFSDFWLKNCCNFVSEFFLRIYKFLYNFFFDFL